MSEITAANIIEMELAAEITALSERLYAIPGGQRVAVEARSANGHWAYERETGRRWAIYDLRTKRFFSFGLTLTDARRVTFEADHPMHWVPREPRPMYLTIRN